MTADFLDAVPAADRTALRAAGRLRRYERGETLLREGDAGDVVLIVLSGWVKVTGSTPEGHETVLSVRGPGALIGELEAIDPRGSRSASVVALEAVEARVLAGEDFRGFLATHGETSLALLRMVMRHLRDTDRRRVEYGGYDTARRLARVLIELATDHGRPTPDGIEIRLHLSQEELAGLVSASRESVGRALVTLRKQGLVSTSKRRLVVHDRSGLVAFTG